MDDRDREKILRIIEQRQWAHTVLLAKKSAAYHAFLGLEKSTFVDRKLSKKHKELIALGISVVKNCESCMEWHLKQALDDGASEDEIIEAVEVGIEMGGGPATVSARFALKVLEFYRSPAGGHPPVANEDAARTGLGQAFQLDGRFRNGIQAVGPPAGVASMAPAPLTSK
ncbi:MAG: carboxymuconolactone decarboxylase family protein [Peptococcaceae bacterium]|jgi:AhpD family alkylhydroperoxidase|nr:carboxymuconolactone decarboxylase family protein [Peptococcaceae bacterium]